MHRVRVAVASMVVAIAVPLMASPAAAATPTNDTFAGATTASVGFSEVVSTADATTDSDDAQLNASCGAPATDASVWYAFSSPNAIHVAVDVSQSDYASGVIVGTGSQGSLSTVVCGPDAVSFSAEANTTYYILAIDDQNDGGNNGGSLHISISEAPPAPTLEVIVDPTGRFDPHTGAAHLTGTYACLDADFLDMFGTASQSNGRYTISGSFEVFEQNTCDGEWHPWSATVTPDNEKFAGGKTLLVALTFSCGRFECSQESVQQTVKLRGGKDEA